LTCQLGRDISLPSSIKGRSLKKRDRKVPKNPSDFPTVMPVFSVKGTDPGISSSPPTPNALHGDAGVVGRERRQRRRLG
jgi:hypothetical protein